MTNLNQALKPGMPPHFECDCVPDLGPSHCHRCSQLLGKSTPWSEAPCASFVTEGLDEQLRGLILATAEEADLQPAWEIGRVARIVSSVAFDLLGAPTPTAAPELFTDPILTPVLTTMKPREQPAPDPVQNTIRPETTKNTRAANREALRQNKEDPPASAPTPVTTASLRLHNAAERIASEKTPDPWRFTKLAREQMTSFGLTEQATIELVENAPLRAGAEKGGVNYYVDGFLILVDHEGECVISIIEREAPISTDGFSRNSVAAAIQQAGENKKLKAKSGGPGRSIPSTAKEMNALLHKHGFVTELTGKGHWVAMHPSHPGKKIIFPSTPSDSRSYLNCVAQIRRETSIDVTLAPKKQQS